MPHPPVQLFQCLTSEASTRESTGVSSSRLDLVKQQAALNRSQNYELMNLQDEAMSAVRDQLETSLQAGFASVLAKQDHLEASLVETIQYQLKQLQSSPKERGRLRQQSVQSRQSNGLSRRGDASSSTDGGQKHCRLNQEVVAEDVHLEPAVEPKPEKDDLAVEAIGSVKVVFPTKSDKPNGEEDKAWTAKKQLLKSASMMVQEVFSGTVNDMQKLAAKHQRRAGTRKFTQANLGDDLGLAERVVRTQAFDMICAGVIAVNAFLIGCSVEYMTRHDREAIELIVASHCCNGFFLVELLFRMKAYGLGFILGEDRKWNLFDLVLVAMSFLDFFNLEGMHGDLSSTLKTMKMLRIVRIFRMFRFFKELSLLALMIVDSLKSLVWAILLLTIIIYVFSIVFTKAASDYIKNAHSKPVDPTVHLHFGSLGRTTYSLVQAMLNGISWGLISDSLMTIGWVLPGLFFFYVFFSVLAVLNIITGVFVDNAVETAKTEREFIMQKEQELKEKYITEMQDMFYEMDEDGSGTLTIEEVLGFFADKRIVAYFQALGLEANDTERLFTLLDSDQGGAVSIDEFLEGCLRLKGYARSIDVHSVLYECKKILTRLEVFMEREGCSSVATGSMNSASFVRPP